MSSLNDRVKAATTSAPDSTEQQRAAPDPVADDSVFQWLEKRRSRLELALPGHIDAGHVIEAAKTSMDKLRSCTPDSIETALMACARFGLAPDGVHAALVPFGKTATFVPMYRGLIDVMHRSGQVLSVRADLIRKHDAWSYQPSAPVPDDFYFRPRIEVPADERGDVVLAYAFAWLRGGGRSQVILLNKQDAIETRDLHSRAYANAEANGKKNSAWHSNFNEQWRKTCIRRLANYVPTSQELVDLLRADTAAEQGRPFIPGEFWESPPPDAAHAGAGEGDRSGSGEA